MKDTSIISAIVSDVSSFSVSLDVEELSLWVLYGGDGAAGVMICLLICVVGTRGVCLIGGRKAYVVEMTRNVDAARASCFWRKTMMKS